MRKILNNIKYQDYLLLVTLYIATLVFYTWGINSWRFSFVGDEWYFFTYAADIVSKSFMVNPFDLNGVFSQNPVLGSIWQALFMWVIGVNNFAWRFSNVILIVPISFFSYTWLRSLINRKVALMTAVLICSSAYFANFLKIGKVNPLALAMLMLLFYLAEQARLKDKRLSYILIGVLLGLSFYVYIGPLFPFILSPYLLLLFKRKNLDKYIQMVIIYLIFVSLALFSIQQHLGPTAEKTILNPEFENKSQVIIKILRNFPLYYKNFDYNYNHFVIGPYLDFITRILALIGSFMVVMKIKNLSYAIILSLYICTIVAIGITSPYVYAPTMRGIYFLPFGYIFAAIALVKISSYLPKILIYILIIVIFGINVYQSQIRVFQLVNHQETALIIKYLQQAEVGSESVLLLSDNSSFNEYNLAPIKIAYDLIESKLTVIHSSRVDCNQVSHKTVLVPKSELTKIDTDLLSECDNMDKVIIIILDPSVSE